MIVDFRVDLWFNFMNALEFCRSRGGCWLPKICADCFKIRRTLQHLILTLHHRGCNLAKHRRGVLRNLGLALSCCHGDLFFNFLVGKGHCSHPWSRKLLLQWRRGFVDILWEKIVLVHGRCYCWSFSSRDSFLLFFLVKENLAKVSLLLIKLSARRNFRLFALFRQSLLYFWRWFRSLLDSFRILRSWFSLRSFH